MTAGNSPTSAAITPNGATAYTANSSADTVSIIDVATLTVIGSIPMPASVDGPQAHSRFMGPNIVTTACTGCGPLVISGDAALTPLGFDRFVNFNTGIISLTGDWNTTRTLSILAGGGTIQTNGHNATIGGSVINGGMLTKDGLGALTLNGPSTADGSIVLQGSLFVNAAHTGTVQLQGGTLGGNGNIATIAATGGTIDPGVNGPAILHATMATLTPAVTLALDINGPAAGTGHDQLDAGAVALGGATLNLHLGFAPVSGTAFTIVKHATGTFAGLAEGAAIPTTGGVMRITYHGGGGSDVVLTFDTRPTVNGPDRSDNRRRPHARPDRVRGR